MNSTILHHLVKSKDRPIHHTAIKEKHGRKWIQYNWQQVYQYSELVGHGLKQLGIENRDRVAVLSETRMEWTLSDFGIMGIGCVTVPIYTSSRKEEVEYILNDSAAKILIVDGEEQLKKFSHVKANCPNIQKVICIEPLKNSPSFVLPWQEFLSSGKDHRTDNQGLFEKSCIEASSAQVATIIYTSGTTGTPKGVVLSHRQVMSELNDVFSLLPVDEHDCSLTFLPMAHVLGRVESWGSIYCGFTMAFAESIDKIRNNMLEIRPTVLIAVPRIFEKIYNAVVTQAETSSTRKKVFDWALSVGRKVTNSRIKNQPPSILTLGQKHIAQQLVFKTLRDRLGGRLRFSLSGGAPLEKRVGEFFHAAGILVLEGYGLTETTAAVCMNTPFDYEFGSVGKPLPDVNIKLADDGEILVKSDKVMLGYYNNDEATNEVFVDGFFATGDIGEWTPQGHLRITDRKKDLIKTAGGKYVAPQKLENLLKMNKYISNVLIHGDQRKYIVALITVDPDAVKKLAGEKLISFQNTSSLTKNPLIREAVREAIAEVNSQLASFETIKTFDILADDFSIEEGELTPSLKLRRKFCDQKYKDLLDKLYGIDKSTL